MVSQTIFSLNLSNVYYTRSRTYSVSPTNISGVVWSEYNEWFHDFPAADVGKELKFLVEERTNAASLSANITFQQQGSGHTTHYVYDRLGNIGQSDDVNNNLDNVTIYGNQYTAQPNFANVITVDINSGWEGNFSSGINSIIFNGRAYQANTLETSRNSEGVQVIKYRAVLRTGDEGELTLNNLMAEINVESKTNNFLFGTPITREFKTVTSNILFPRPIPTNACLLYTSPSPRD